MNYDDVFDLVINSTFNNEKLPQKTLDAITGQMYVDRRGGPLGALYSSDEFMEALEWQSS